MTSEEQLILPSNIKQIGSIGDGIKVYMEDYVCTYIQQYSASDKNKEKTAVLVGHCCNVDDCDIIFVSGVIQGRYCTKNSGMAELTEKSWQYIYRQMEKYFRDCDIVGWVYIQPGFEDYINENICSFQNENADKGLKLLYLTDPQENISSFYTWDTGGNVFTQLKGYIVYYDKNEGMHEYMLENKLSPVNATPDLEMPERGDAGVKARRAAKKPEIKRSRRTRLSAERNMVNMLGAVSFVMLVVCMIMGAGLIQNSERLSSMEGKLNRLQAELDGTKSVFAAQTTSAEPASQITTQAAVQTTAAPAVQPQTQKQLQADAVNTYTVQSGDTLIKISEKMYGTDDRVQDIMELNNKSSNTIFAGETIMLP